MEERGLQEGSGCEVRGFKKKRIDRKRWEVGETAGNRVDDGFVLRRLVSVITESVIYAKKSPNRALLNERDNGRSRHACLRCAYFMTWQDRGSCTEGHL